MAGGRPLSLNRMGKTRIFGRVPDGDVGTGTVFGFPCVYPRLKVFVVHEDG